MEATIIITEGTSARAQNYAAKYPNANIFFADSNPVPNVLVKMGKYIQLPDPNSPSFIHVLLTSCLDHAADTLVLLADQERTLVGSQKQLFEEYNIEIIW